MGATRPKLLIASLLVATGIAVKVIEFGTERVEGNYLEVQPIVLSQRILDFSICVRFKFWTWGTKILFGSQDIFLALLQQQPATISSGVVVMNNSAVARFETSSLKISPTLWNSICLAYNSSNASVTIAINNFSSSYRSNLSMDVISTLKNRIMIGDSPNYHFSGDYRFSGQVTDFNIWNKTLNELEIKSFTIECSNGFPDG
jgi:hypothetical protein